MLLHLSLGRNGESPEPPKSRGIPGPETLAANLHPSPAMKPRTPREPSVSYSEPRKLPPLRDSRLPDPPQEGVDILLTELVGDDPPNQGPRIPEFRMKTTF